MQVWRRRISSSARRQKSSRSARWRKGDAATGNDGKVESCGRICCEGKDWAARKSREEVADSVEGLQEFVATNGDGQTDSENGAKTQGEPEQGKERDLWVEEKRES